MAKNREKTNLLHFKDGNQYEVMREKSSGKLFIKNTEIEVTGKVIRNNQQKTKAYDFNKPFDAQDLGDEWDDYAWSGKDF